MNRRPDAWRMIGRIFLALLVLFDTPTPGYPKIVRQWSRYARRGSEIIRELAQGKPSITPGDIGAHVRAVRQIVARRWVAKAKSSTHVSGHICG